MVRIGFSQCLSDRPWRDAINRSMEIQASLYPKIDLSIYEAHNNVQHEFNAPLMHTRQHRVKIFHSIVAGQNGSVITNIIAVIH